MTCITTIGANDWGGFAAREMFHGKHDSNGLSSMPRIVSQSKYIASHRVIYCVATD